MKLKTLFLMLIVVFLFQGCAPKVEQRVSTTPFVMVRGSELRSDVFSLPLEKEEIPKLLDYIKRGGDIKGVGIVDFYNKEFYTALLNLLTADMDKDGKFELEDLFDDVEGKRTLKAETGKYFVKPIIYSIFDSRLKRPSKKSFRPFALSDKGKNLWWIFYRQKGDPRHVISVMVTVPIYRELHHYEK